jgi:glucokinase
MTPFASPRLLADVGGTYARFTIEVAPRVFRHGARLRCAEHASLFDAVQAYLSGLAADGAERIEHAAIGIANPVDGDQVRMTNHHWQFSIEQLRQRLGLETLVVVNDFTALAMALPRLAREERRQVGGGAPRAASALGLLGAGTGLGVSGLIPVAGDWVALAGEGGHVAMAARDERELLILSHARRQFAHVSFERVLSGPGIELIYRALAEEAGQAGTSLPASEITRRALDDSEPLCVETVDAFCALLGTAASNLALTLGALGGIYVGGGIVPRLGEYFDRSPFRARFEDKGRFTDYMRAIPTYVVTAEHAAFVGVSALLARR